MPKLDGNRVAIRGRVRPETHERAVEAARQQGLSLSDYLGRLIDRDTGVSMTSGQQELPIQAA